MHSPIITLLTDFGITDAFVGIMKGVILGINPEVHLVDLAHGIPPQQVVPAALLLRSAVGFFPPGTIHVAVVDPGVGSERQPLVIETERGILVGPDNGVLWPAAVAMHGAVARRVENLDLCRRPISQTFHGRDIFAPVAAHLSRGVDPDTVGPITSSVVEMSIPATHCVGSVIHGEIIYVDHFGNLVTNVAAEAVACFPAPEVSVSIGHKLVAGLATAYVAVPVGAPLALVGSWGVVEIAVRNGSAARMFAAGPGTPVTVVVERRDA
jgi:hypothetical protein